MMELTGKISRRILLLSLLSLTVPLVMFPEQFGTQLARASLINAFYELVYYGFIVYLLNRKVTLVQLLQASGACLVYRFGVGASFGFLIAATYGLDLRVAVTMGMSSYLPAIILHVIGAPFILRPVLVQFYESHSRRRRLYRAVPVEAVSKTGPASIAVSRERGTAQQPMTPTAVTEPSSDLSAMPSSAGAATMSAPGGVDGFERAVRYIGEHGAVELACVIDQEGLLLSNFRRGGIVAEDLAPLALLLVDSNTGVLDRGGFGRAEKIDMTLKDKRIIVAHGLEFDLMVVADRHSDDFLNIRINQATDMIGKYSSERYGLGAVANAEKSHVSSAQ